MTVTGPTPGPTPYNPIVSTKQLTPDGILGFAKALAALVASILVGLAEFLPDQWKKWAQLALAVCGIIAVYQVPNKVVATPPAPVTPADTPPHI